ncbi:MAG: hypothetical protein HKN90_02740, partial [Flavobacteriaceae bacterium]|nr:hypothetical protein [Flavobacteriaceae bacterium]
QGTAGQVWELAVLHDVLFCGHDSGTFMIRDNKAMKIANQKGSWLFREIPGNQNVLLQGNYNGIHVLQNSNGNWSYKNKIEGFNISSQFFEIHENKIFVNHEYKGVYELSIDREFKKVERVKKLDSFQINQASALNKYQGKIYYAGNQGFYEYISDKGFIRDSIISDNINDGFVSGRMSVNDEGIWIFGNNDLLNLVQGKLNQSLEFKRIPFPTAPLSSSLKGFQKLSKIDETNYLIGSINGYVLVDINDLEQRNFTVNINKVGNYNNDGSFNKALEIINDQEFDYSSNGFQINYSVAHYDVMRRIEYQTRLLGRSQEWSEWSTESMVKYENIPAGVYEFNVRARIGNKISDNVASYTFKISKPWYYSNLMLVLYLMAVLLFSVFMHNVYKRYYNKEQRKLIDKNKKALELARVQNEKEIIRIKNEQLENDIKNKSKELAASTMSVVKNKELLTKMKEHLRSAENQESVNKVLEIIDENLKNNDNWELFKEAFNNVDRKFLKKLKKTHPKLSPNDIKLCAYLRLNLSSKEIAPLFNISARSVEIKRYRLRKKLKLSHEDNLVNYIIEL